MVQEKMQVPNIGLEIEEPQTIVEEEYGVVQVKKKKISSSFHTNSDIPTTENVVRYKYIVVMAIGILLFVASTSSQITTIEKSLDHSKVKTNYHENVYESVTLNNESMTNKYYGDNTETNSHILDDQSGEKSQKLAYLSVHPQNLKNIQAHYLHNENTSPFSSELYEEYALGSAKLEQEKYDLKMEKIREKYGAWDFHDDFDGTRPSIETYDDYPNRDIPSSDFPTNAWQTDKDYVEKFIDESLQLIRRTRRGIYEEYGYGSKPYNEDELKDLLGINLINPPNYPLKNGREGHYKVEKEEYTNGIAWMTGTGYDALVRKLLHTMMTNDDFFVVLAGHSAAAGHGNQFFQTKSMQFHYLMEPIFDKLGMNLITRNMAMGGLGTVQSSLAGSDIYGERDFLIWDSMMTEKEPDKLDVFNRHALISGQRVPVIMMYGFGEMHINLRKALEESVGGWWHGDFHEPKGFIHTSDNGISNIPYPSQGLNCESNWDNCKENRFASRCWIDRKDISPDKEQNEKPQGQVSWHPGWRKHRWESRKWSLLMLHALETSLLQWSEKGIESGHPLVDEYWHIGDRYDKIRKTVKTSPIYDENEETCESHIFSFIPRICRLSLSAATEFTPRADLEQGSIRHFIVPAPNGYVPHLGFDEYNLYDGPDLLIPEIKILEDDVDVHAIAITTTGSSKINQRRKLFKRRLKNNFRSNVKGVSKEIPTYDHRNLGSIVPGQGWFLDSHPPGFCDGTAQSECNRGKDNNCLLYGHNDSHGGIMGDGLSGWLVMQLPNIKEGVVLIRLETWKGKGQNPLTMEWTEENNGLTHDTSPYIFPQYEQSLGEDEIQQGSEDASNDESSNHNRNLKEADPLPEGLIFEIAINGEIKEKWGRDEFEEQRYSVAYNNDVFVLLDDSTMQKRFQDKEDEPGETIEVAIRISGVKREATFSLTHVYWA